MVDKGFLPVGKSYHTLSAAVEATRQPVATRPPLLAHLSIMKPSRRMAVSCTEGREVIRALIMAAASSYVEQLMLPGCTTFATFVARIWCPPRCGVLRPIRSIAQFSPPSVHQRAPRPPPSHRRTPHASPHQPAADAPEANPEHQCTARYGIWKTYAPQMSNHPARPAPPTSRCLTAASPSSCSTSCGSSPQVMPSVGSAASISRPPPPPLLLPLQL